MLVLMLSVLVLMLSVLRVVHINNLRPPDNLRPLAGQPSLLDLALALAWPDGVYETRQRQLGCYL